MPSSGSKARMGRPPQWTVSRSRKLARLYVFTTLTLEKIIKVLEEDGFRPRKNSAQKTLHNMLDNDPRYLRPVSRSEMTQRIQSLSISPTRWRGQRTDQRASPVEASASDPFAQLERAYSYDSHRDQSMSVDDAPGGHQLNTANTQHPEMSFVSNPQAFPPRFTYTTFPGSLPPSEAPASVVAGTSTFLPPQPTAVPGTAVPNTPSFTELRRRLSGRSIRYARQVWDLIHDFTIASASDATERPAISIQRSSLSEVDSEAGYALPGDFINVHKLGCGEHRGQDHFVGKCWCSVAVAIAMEQSAWVLPTGELSPRAILVFEERSQESLGLRDCFGNTPLHVFAALQGYQMPLLCMVSNSPNLRATNTAGQTFLHVLSVEWFLDLASPSAPLKQLLAYIRDNASEMLYATDVYGRTFFHRARSLLQDSETLHSILSPSDAAFISRRDAFGFNPLARTDLGGGGSFRPPRQLGLFTPLSEARASRSRDRTTPRPQDLITTHHFFLVDVILESFRNPLVEDAQGRNGLHCLAEAALDGQTVEDQGAAASAGRLFRQRHRTNSQNVGLLVVRLRHLQALLAVPSQPDLNHYDRDGNTVLGAFIYYLSDDQEDRDKTLSTILNTLIRRGARVEGRNRRGETALLFAARLGRKIALTTLLERGANVHARDAEGRGVLQIIDATCRNATDDAALYARLEACRGLLTGRRNLGVLWNPGVVMEWKGY